MNYCDSGKATANQKSIATNKLVINVFVEADELLLSVVGEVGGEGVPPVGVVGVGAGAGAVGEVGLLLPGEGGVGHCKYSSWIKSLL